MGVFEFDGKARVGDPGVGGPIGKGAVDDGHGQEREEWVETEISEAFVGVGGPDGAIVVSIPKGPAIKKGVKYNIKESEWRLEKKVGV